MNPPDKWLIYTPSGIDIDSYPSIVRHLEHHKPRLEGRAVEQPYWQLQQAQNRDRVWDNPKIIFPDIAPEARFAFDETGLHLDMTGFIIAEEDLYLLAVLNTSHVFSFFCGISATIRGGFIRWRRQYVERIPIPAAPDGERQRIADLARLCLDAKGQGVEAIEREIDARVAELYGLKPSPKDES